MDCVNDGQTASTPETDNPSSFLPAFEADPFPCTPPASPRASCADTSLLGQVNGMPQVILRLPMSCLSFNNPLYLHMLF